jgi:hypothetical protein
MADFFRLTGLNCMGVSRVYLKLYWYRPALQSDTL